MLTHKSLASAAPRRARRGLALSERRLLLATVDVATVGIAFLVAFNLRSAPVRHETLAVPRVALGITLLVWLTSAALVDGYRLPGTVSLLGIFRTVVGSMAISFMGLLLVFFVSPYRITRPTLLLWLPLATAGLLAWRLAYRRVFASDTFAGSLAVIADAKSFKRIWPDATGNMRGLYRVVEIVNPKRASASDILRELVAEGRVDQLVLGVRDNVSRDLFRTLVDCYDNGVPVRSLSDLYEELTGRLLLDQLGHGWLLSLPMRSETSRLYAALKRATDLVCGLLGLLALGAILPFAAVALKLQDGGPIFYRQPRLGQYGRPFVIFKLRSMQVDNSGQQRQTEAGDARVTRVGRILRHLHLDELPQSWNIVRGDMSLIGPRPEQPAYIEVLQHEIDFYNTRLSVRPGLTGWAQINYGYGAGPDGARVKLSYDLYYIKRQSFSLDLLILVRTVFTVFSVGGRRSSAV